jgi:hypothetical protein
MMLKMFSEMITKAKDQLNRTLALLGMLFSVILTLWFAVAIGNFTNVTMGILLFLVCCAASAYANAG